MRTKRVVGDVSELSSAVTFVIQGAAACPLHYYVFVSVFICKVAKIIPGPHYAKSNARIINANA